MYLQCRRFASPHELLSIVAKSKSSSSCIWDMSNWILNQMIHYNYELMKEVQRLIFSALDGVERFRS